MKIRLDKKEFEEINPVAVYRTGNHPGLIPLVYIGISLFPEYHYTDSRTIKRIKEYFGYVEEKNKEKLQDIFRDISRYVGIHEEYNSDSKKIEKLAKDLP